MENSVSVDTPGGHFCPEYAFLIYLSERRSIQSRRCISVEKYRLAMPQDGGIGTAINFQALPSAQPGAFERTMIFIATDIAQSVIHYGKMGIYGSIAHHNLCRRDYTRRREVPDGWYSTGDGMIGHFLGAIDGYGKHSDAYIHGSGKLGRQSGAYTSTALIFVPILSASMSIPATIFSPYRCRPESAIRAAPRLPTPSITAHCLWVKPRNWPSDCSRSSTEYPMRVLPLMPRKERSFAICDGATFSSSAIRVVDTYSTFWRRKVLRYARYHGRRRKVGSGRTPAPWREYGRMTVLRYSWIVNAAPVLRGILQFRFL